MPPTTKPKQPLQVTRDMWNKDGCEYVRRDGTLVAGATYEQAREYARQNGYNGIKIKYA